MILSNIDELSFATLIGKCRALCLDYGDKRVGVAVSDINWQISSPLKVFESHGVYPNILKVVSEYDVGVVVVGSPVSLNGGNSGTQLEKVKKFVKKLEQLLPRDISIVYWDERLSSVAASRFLVEAEMSLSQKKKNIDKVAASFILHGFLDYVANKQ